MRHLNSPTPDVVDGSTDRGRSTARRRRRATRERRGKRRGMIIEMLARPAGAPVAEIMAVTGQRARTVHAVFIRLRLAGMAVTPTWRPDGRRSWHTPAHRQAGESDVLGGRQGTRDPGIGPCPS